MAPSPGEPSSVSGAGDKSESVQAKSKRPKKAEKPAKKSKESKRKTAKSVKKPEEEEARGKRKPNGLVEELKLFQNHKLLNQQDPMQHLQQQLGQILQNDDENNNNNSSNRKLKLFQQQTKTNGLSNSINNNQNKLESERLDDRSPPANQLELAPTSGININQLQQQQHRGAAGASPMLPVSSEQGQPMGAEGGTENISTIKKGVLWQQQQYEKFHQRLFSRWKKRYFILTTDYLVCFKRSSSKVGRSEMGQFLYKTSLNDIAQVDWLKPKKSDKGAIILRILGDFNLFLWCKSNLDEWMFMIRESIDRYKIRKSCIQLQNGPASQSIFPLIPETISQKQAGAPQEASGGGGDFYANTAKQEEVEAKAGGQTIEGNQSLTSDNKQSELKSGGSSEPGSSAHEKEEEERKENEPNGVSGSARRDSEPMINHAPDNDTKGQAGANRSQKSDSNNGSGSGSRSNSSSSRGPRKQLECKKGTSGSPGNLSSASGPLNGRAAAARSGSSSPKSGRDKDNNAPDQVETNCASSSKFRRASDTNSSSGSLTREKRPAKRKSSKNDEQAAAAELIGSSHKSQRVLGDKEPSGNSNRNDSAIKDNKTLTNGSAGGLEERAFASEDQGLRAERRLEEGEQTGRRREEKAAKSMIRRDDSWQSLVSLTRVGKVTPMMQVVGQRSLYAQQMLQQQQQQQPSELEEPGNLARSGFANATNKQIISLIESNATPSRLGRNSLVRHQSSVGGQRVLRASLFDQRHQHPASFDAPSNCHISPDTLANSSASHRQKLLQLQLLHSSNDYFRHPNRSVDEYGQIYNGPESATTANHYGYSSMRSNLKSAASEFSFVRPAPAGYIQSTLPHQPKLQANYTANKQQQPFGVGGGGGATSGAQPLNRNSLILTQTGAGLAFQQLSNSNDHNNNDISLHVVNCQATPASQQFLVHPVTGERILNQRELFGSEPVAPLRELPLKPNKKRQSANETNQHASKPDASKKASLTSTISCFFKRAFSRRSRRAKGDSGSSKRRLDEACSSSIGALAVDGPLLLPLAPSAFSTGSKSVLVEARLSERAQNDRMIDMIEAFTSKHSTALAGSGETKQLTSASSNLENIVDLQIQLQQQQQQEQEEQLRLSNRLVQQQQQQQLQQTPLQMRKSFNNFGSPLHKSNSISTSMGLSQCEEPPGKMNLLYDNSSAALAALETGGASPMLMRSTKVMSANLGAQNGYNLLAGSQKQNFLLSPRVSSRRSNGPSGCALPRPSSIYGQPSMIASPACSPAAAATTRDFSNNNNNFGFHRNSLHNQYYQARERGNPPEARPVSSSRHHQISGCVQLDTTREVAEELGSPVSELPALANKHLLNNGVNKQLAREGPQQSGRYSSMRDNFANITSSPSSGRLQQHYNRQAIVNPILQSPTMDAIYDNHPMAQAASGGAELAAYSHYDNHNQLLMGGEQRVVSPLIRATTASSSLVPMQFAASPNSHYQLPGGKLICSTPSRVSGRLAAANSEEGQTRQRDWIMEKPAAIVAPSQQQNNSPLLERLNTINYNQLGENHNSNMIIRGRQNQSNYQQSPLVTTNQNRRQLANGLESVVNIAGAPGINLEPALAASLLRGTNIDAYESVSTFDRRSNLNQSQQSNRKTFLVSTRLSNSMANKQTNGALRNHENSTDDRSESDEASSSTTGTGSGGERRNWITSKLVQQRQQDEDEDDD